MKEVTIKVPENQLQFFMELMHQLGLEAQENEVFEVPEFHKEIIRKRLENIKPENLHDWEEVKDKFTFK